MKWNVRTWSYIALVAVLLCFALLVTAAPQAVETSQPIEKLLSFVSQGAADHFSRIRNASGKAVSTHSWPSGKNTIREWTWACKGRSIFAEEWTLDVPGKKRNTKAGPRAIDNGKGHLLTPEIYACFLENRTCALLNYGRDTQPAIGSLLFDPFDLTFAELGTPLANLVKHNRASLAAEKTTLGGKEVILLVQHSSSPPGNQRKYWIDPKSGFSIVRKEWISDSTRIVIENVVEEHADRIWFPSQGWLKHWLKAENGTWELVLRREWRISDLKINAGLVSTPLSFSNLARPGMRIRDLRHSPPLEYVYKANEKKH